MHVHGWGLITFLVLSGFTLGANFGFAIGTLIASRKQADRNEMIVLARLHEISQDGPQVVA